MRYMNYYRWSKFFFGFVPSIIVKVDLNTLILLGTLILTQNIYNLFYPQNNIS